VFRVKKVQTILAYSASTDPLAKINGPTGLLLREREGYKEKGR